VRGTLFVMPVVMTATAVATTAYGAVIGVGTAFFVLVAVTMFSKQVLDKAVDTPVLVLLFQPMPRERRLPVPMIVEGWLGSVALVLSGALLLVVTWLGPPDVVPFAALLAVASVAFLLQTREATSQYARALWRATVRGFAGTRAAEIDCEVPVDALLARLAPGASPAEQAQAQAQAALRTRAPRLHDGRLLAAVQVQVASARSLLAAERDLSPAWPLLAMSVHEELARVQANSFSLLCCSRAVAAVSAVDIFLDAEARIANGTADDRANAIELLDVTLPKWLKRPVVALVEDHGPLQMLRKLGHGPVLATLTARERLASMADDASLGTWTASLVQLSETRNGKGQDMAELRAPEIYPPEIDSVLWLRSIDIFAGLPVRMWVPIADRDYEGKARLLVEGG
jgi:hypothetical protein